MSVISWYEWVVGIFSWMYGWTLAVLFLFFFRRKEILVENIHPQTHEKKNHAPPPYHRISSIMNTCKNSNKHIKISVLNKIKPKPGNPKKNQKGNNLSNRLQPRTGGRARLLARASLFVFSRLVYTFLIFPCFFVGSQVMALLLYNWVYFYDLFRLLR